MSDNDPRISDNPSFKKLREDVKGIRLLARARPLLKLFGVEISDDPVAKTEKLAQATAELTSLPDRFNDLFAEQGWIAYDRLNSEIMRSAVELGEAGDVDGAEELLVEHFDEETIDWGIKFMWAVEAFRPRERLARLALTDYLEGRYHACVPVVLMILDGIVNDIEQKRGFSRGFFAENADLTAWDSIAAHSRGACRPSSR